MPLSSNLSTKSLILICLLAHGARADSIPFREAGQASVSVAPSTLKIRPYDKGTNQSKASISAARNEFEAFQVIIHGGNSGVTGVSASDLILENEAGKKIDGNSIRLYREEYLNITKPSNSEGKTGLWPDALIPDIDEVDNQKRNAFPFDVPAGENRVIYVEVHVPENADKGKYRGALKIIGIPTNEGLPILSQVVQIPVNLNIWNFTLPSTSSLPTAFHSEERNACLAYGNGETECYTRAVNEPIRLQLARFMLDHRITIDPAIYGPELKQWDDASQGYDWEAYDGIWGSLLDGTDTRLRLKGAKATSWRYAWGTNENKASYQNWANHFQQKNWFDRTFHYTCDEPDNGCSWADITAKAAIIHNAVPEFRTLVTTNIKMANVNVVTGAIDILTPVVNHMDDKPGFETGYEVKQRSKYNDFLSSNSKRSLWWYQSCMSHGCLPRNSTEPEVLSDLYTGWPSYMVDASAVQNRAIEWLTFSYDVQGELYWAVDFALERAWSDVYNEGGNGDGTLFYSGTPNKIGGSTNVPIPSLRLKMLREGMEDYEYLKMVSNAGDAAFARQIAKSLFPSAHSSNQPHQKLMKARATLAQRITKQSR